MKHMILIALMALTSWACGGGANERSSLAGAKGGKSYRGYERIETKLTSSATTLTFDFTRAASEKAIGQLTMVHEGKPETGILYEDEKSEVRCPVCYALYAVDGGGDRVDFLLRLDLDGSVSLKMELHGQTIFLTTTKTVRAE